MRDLNEANLTDAVIAAMTNARDARTKEILIGLIKHLHAFIREVNLTEDEWLSGIDTTVYQTGQFEATQMHMSKRGSPYLRHALWQAASMAILHDDELRAYYDRKRQEGKHTARRRSWPFSRRCDITAKTPSAPSKKKPALFESRLFHLSSFILAESLILHPSPFSLHPLSFSPAFSWCYTTRNNTIAPRCRRRRAAGATPAPTPTPLRYGDCRAWLQCSVANAVEARRR